MELARDVMSQPVRQLVASAPVRDAAAFLQRHGISGAPVMDEHGHWIGVFTQNDLARFVASRLAERSLEIREPPGDLFGDTPVREFTSAGLYTVFPDSTLSEVIHTMTHRRVHRVFVIDGKGGALLGVITSMDILRWMAGRKSQPQRRRAADQKAIPRKKGPARRFSL